LTPAVAAATGGGGEEDAGAALAGVNAVTQIGGSIGTALLNSIAATAAAAALREAPADPGAATVVGFDAALLTAVGLLLFAAVMVALIMPGGRRGGATGLQERAQDPARVNVR